MKFNEFFQLCNARANAKYNVGGIVKPINIVIMALKEGSDHAN